MTPIPGKKALQDPASSASLDSFVQTSARLLGLPLEPSWQAAVKANLELTLQHAAVVDAFVLPDEAEPAPTFQA